MRPRGLKPGSLVTLNGTAEAVPLQIQFGTEFLLAGDGHSIYTKGRASECAAEFEVVADFGDVVEHVVEVAGDGDLLDRVVEFAVLDPQAAGAAREIAGDEIDTETEEFRYEQTFPDVADDFFGRACAGLEK